MNQVPNVFQGIELLVYIDDIVIYVASLEDHNQKLRQPLTRLKFWSHNYTRRVEVRPA